MLPSLDQLIDRIHEAGLVPSLWPDTLSAISAAAEGNGGYLFGVRDGYLDAISTANHAEHVKAFMTDGWAERDLALKRALALNHAGFVNDQDLLTDEEILTDDVYANFYRRHGIGYRAGTLIPIPSGDSVAIVLPRHQDHGPVPRRIVAFLDTLRPHLARAALTANRLGFERARAQTEALQALGLPAAVLRASGRLFAANAGFEALVPALFQDRAQRLCASDAAADRLLAESMVAFSRNDGNVVRSIAIAGGTHRVPVVAHLVPVRRAAHDLFSQAVALLVVTPVDRSKVPSAEVLQGLFDLTPAEAHVARAVASTQSVNDVANARGVSRETVRSQIKAVLDKTGLNRQSELVSLLVGTSFPFNS